MTADSDPSTEPSAAYAAGAERLADVYAGLIPERAEGDSGFNDVAVRTLFAEVWNREVLSIRDRRFLILGAIAAMGAHEMWMVQARASLMREEMTADELRETLIILAPYAGFPNVAPLVGQVEALIAELA